jgi:hypothetical protein
MALAGGDSVKHAYMAGGFKYSVGASSRFCAKPEIQARAKEIVAERHKTEDAIRKVAAEESGVTLAWTEKNYKYVVLSALRGDPVRDATGRMKRDPETGQVIYKPDRYVAVKALDSLTRMKGGFIDRLETGGPGDFARMTSEQLNEIIVVTARELGLPDSAVKLLEDLSPKKEAAE